MSEITRKTALITGATSGIGKAYATALAARGYDLIITGRREAVIKEVAVKLQKRYGVSVTVCLVDLACDHQREKFMDFVATQSIDFLVNNAGYGADKSFTEDRYSKQEAMVKVHILASIELAHSVAQSMKVRQCGTIVNISSLAGFLMLPTSAMYCATKAFLTSFSQSLALELKPYNIKVQGLCPGFVHTDFHNKLDIAENKCQNKGPIKWMDADTLVKSSLRALEAPWHVICVPGIYNQMGYQLLKVIPKTAYYTVVDKFRHIEH